MRRNKGTIADRSGTRHFVHYEIHTAAIVAPRYWPSDKPLMELHCSEVIGVVDDKDRCCRPSVAARPNIRRVTMVGDSFRNGPKTGK